MKKYLQKKLNNEKGMTLIELLAVIVIIAIIAAIAIPAIGNIIENSRYGAVKSDFQNALAAANLYIAEEGTDPTDLDSLSEYIEDAGSLIDVTISRVTTAAGDTAGADEGSLEILGSFDLNGTTESLTVAQTNAELSEMSAAEFKDLIQN
ncbi:Type IV pilin PilA [Planococcus halocryophilus Or1]|uniref:Pilus assembly protein PilA n=1 Tax=Planococcus halocryophilus TaxID=1215089 RepID=A0A1C7DMK5_9BACL|nr:prepilin-type N-terminal cleavage/methylation domain-containing protein [Planococcus halocryophilus]ANU12809.1 pilus assembly protein PilA [Planococcus halocryophilus]EMF45298.1 Type IV pilin PilA [Planococcus halocryophilus Or1]